METSDQVIHCRVSYEARPIILLSDVDRIGNIGPIWSAHHQNRLNQKRQMFYEVYSTMLNVMIGLDDCAQLPVDPVGLSFGPWKDFFLGKDFLGELGERRILEKD
jgi:hypothetical protein